MTINFIFGAFSRYFASKLAEIFGPKQVCIDMHGVMSRFKHKITIPYFQLIFTSDLVGDTECKIKI